MSYRGVLQKLAHQLDASGRVSYELVLGAERLALEPYLGKTLGLHFHGSIYCLHCGRKTKKSYLQGFCFPCSQHLPQADLCQLRPELCHFHQGTCRDSSWGQRHCFIDHTVYLAVSSGLKVGMTRTHQQLTRWVDQGASQALAIACLNSRRQAGLLELAFKKHVADKTNWRIMLKGCGKTFDLPSEGERLWALLPSQLAVSKLASEKVWSFYYPLLQLPAKITSLNLEKTPQLEGSLLGIKGQYLILEQGVLNIRKFAGYDLEVKFI